MSGKIKTVGEILASIADLEHRSSVYQELVNFLGRFVSSDSHTPTKGIHSIGPEDAVPEEAIEQVQEELREVLKKIDMQVKKFKAHKLSGGSKSPKKTTTRRKRSAPKRKKVRKKASQKGKEKAAADSA